MSGPKCNEFELSEQRRQEELRRIEEELRRKQEEERQRRLEEERKKMEERRERLESIQESNRRFEEELERQLKEQYNKELQETYAQREQEIIANAIDEAMVDMGYELIADSKPEEKQNISAKAQVFSFSDGVGIQVVEVGERISMEVVGLGTSNRMPTETEKEYLEDQMEAFCEVFYELEKKLLEEGIVRSRVIQKLPPDKRFARVLNLERFDRKKEVNTLQGIMKSKERKTTDSEAPMMKKKIIQKREK